MAGPDEDSTPGDDAAASIGHVDAFPQPLACMGQVGLPQQEGVAFPAGFRATACATPSTAAHTGDSRNDPEVSAPRTRSARHKARMERIPRHHIPWSGLDPFQVRGAV